MVITSLKLTSFKSFVGMELPLEAPRVFLAGQNAVGKSSVREFVKWVLTGRCQALDARGSGSELLVPEMAATSGVAGSLTINDLGTVERMWSAGGSSLHVQGFTGTKEAQQSALLDRLGVTEPFLQACLDSRLFLNLGHADAKSLVLSLLNVRIRLGTADDAPIMSLDELDEAYDQAFENRKIAKARVKAFHLPPKPEERPTPLVADVDAKLAILKTALEEAIAATGSVTGQRKVLERKRDELSRPIALPTEEALTRLEAQIAELEERLGIMTDEIAEAMPTAAEVAAMEPGDPALIPVLRSRAEALRAHKPKQGCVIDAGVVCPVDKRTFTARAKELEATIEEMAAACLQVIAPAVVPVQAEDPKVAIRRELAGLVSLQGQIAQDVEAEDRRVKELTDTEALLSALGDTTEQEATIAELRGRITKGEAIRFAATAYYKAQEAFASALETQKAYQADVARLEELCAHLGPSGVRVQALSESMGTFEAAVNAFCQPFGWTLAFVLNPWGVQVNGRPVETYSWSEQYRIGIAIQLSVALLSGLKFAIVDELDLLDQRNRDLMGVLLYRAPLDQIIILATREPGQALPAQVPNMVSFRLDRREGRTVVVDRS